MQFRVISFNVNGLRSYSKYLKEKNHTFNDYIKNKLNATVLCVQESRGSESNLAQFHTLEDFVTFSSLNKKNSGKYGVSTFIRKDFFCSGKTDKIAELKEFDGDGRYILTKHGSFDILNCYFPFICESEYRSTDLQDREKADHAMRFYYGVGRYVSKNPKTILLGDFNAIYNIQDSYMYFREHTRIKNSGILHTEKNKENIIIQEEKEFDFGMQFYEGGRYPNPIISPTELPFLFENIKHLNNYLFELPNREWTYKLIHGNNYIDAFRIFSQENEVYTCWNQIFNLRKVNLGTRIDLILIPKCLKHFIINSNILSEEYGSDHCPVIADFDMVIKKEEKNILNRKNNLLSFFGKKKSE